VEWVNSDWTQKLLTFFEENPNFVGIDIQVDLIIFAMLDGIKLLWRMECMVEFIGCEFER